MKPRIVAWAAVARGIDRVLDSYCLIIAGSTKSEAAAEAEAKRKFTADFPGVSLRGVELLKIREGD